MRSPEMPTLDWLNRAHAFTTHDVKAR
jgi:hypothetical protein